MTKPSFSGFPDSMDCQPDHSMGEAAERTDNHLRQISSDYMYTGKDTTKEICGGSSQLAILRYGPPDKRRNQEPLRFSQESVQCFCDWRRKPLPSESWFLVSPASSFFLRKNCVLQFANHCGPEPTAEHYADLMDIASRLTVPCLTVVNLPGSGASVPQHFHTQIFPLAERAVVGRSEPFNSIAALWRNVLPAETSFAWEDGTKISEILFPVWGIKLEFPEHQFPRRVGHSLHHVLQRNLRLPSQLALSYNIYVDSTKPKSVTVLFRESRKERVFLLPEVHALIEKLVDRNAALDIAASDNRFWRWAWLECMGGFPARDESFSDTSRFGWEFWKGVWSIITLDQEYRPAVLDRIKGAFVG